MYVCIYVYRDRSFSRSAWNERVKAQVWFSYSDPVWKVICSEFHWKAA